MGLDDNEDRKGVIKKGVVSPKGRHDHKGGTNDDTGITGSMSSIGGSSSCIQDH